MAGDRTDAMHLEGSGDITGCYIELVGAGITAQEFIGGQEIDIKLDVLLSDSRLYGFGGRLMLCGYRAV
jgi:hypothetical protein